MQPPCISVVLPVLDDGPALACLLGELTRQRGVQLQIIVVDGGSTDPDRAMVERAGATWLVTRPGRARQMNAGAQQADAEWLCCLHADSRLVDDRQLRRAVDQLRASATRQPVAGHWPVVFTQAGDRQPGRLAAFLYRFMQAKSATGRRYTINGDQGLLMRRTDFQALGGFDERLPFLEDQRFAAKLAAAGAWQRLPGYLLTSARRFEVEGEYPRYLLMGLIMAMYIVDVPAFFAWAPGVYAQQAQTGRLLLMPYMRLLRRLMRGCGPGASARVCWRMAGVAMRELWQVFFVFDVASGSCDTNPKGRWASLYTQRMAPWVENPLTQALLMLCLLLCLFGPVQWMALWQERARRT